LRRLSVDVHYNRTTDADQCQREATLKVLIPGNVKFFRVQIIYHDILNRFISLGDGNKL